MAPEPTTAGKFFPRGRPWEHISHAMDERQETAHAAGNLSNVARPDLGGTVQA
jgi:hypothetical protein